LAQIQLVQGAYTARSLIANAQRCVNLYPEKNTDDAEVPYTHYPTPGLVTLNDSLGVGEVRGLYTATDGKLFAVIGDKLYFVTDSFGLTLLGSIATSSGHVSMYDNKEVLIVLDGSTVGWQVPLNTLGFSLFAPSNFVGGNQIRYMDTFLLSSTLDANVQASDSAATTYTALALATIAGDADRLQILDVVHKECWMFGRRTCEVWSNVGGFPFPLAPIPGVFIQHGIAAISSLAKWGLDIFWLSQDNNGKALVMQGTNYTPQIISTPAIADEMEKYSRIDDAIGFCYQQGAHIFYVLTFPTADKTWVYDKSERLWHQRAWTDENGNLHRHRANCVAFAYGKTVVGDWQNGRLYEWDLEAYTDFGGPISCIRSFPHLLNSGKRVGYNYFMADVEAGSTEDPAADPMLSLRWSDDRGKTFGNPIEQSVGMTGQYRVTPTWWRLGMARDRVFELSWAADAQIALNGAWTEVDPAET
jgi:hypothetical protein